MKSRRFIWLLSSTLAWGCGGGDSDNIDRSGQQDGTTDDANSTGATTTPDEQPAATDELTSDTDPSEEATDAAASDTTSSTSPGTMGADTTSASGTNESTSSDAPVDGATGDTADDATSSGTQTNSASGDPDAVASGNDASGDDPPGTETASDSTQDDGEPGPTDETDAETDEMDSAADEPETDDEEVDDPPNEAENTTDASVLCTDLDSGFAPTLPETHFATLFWNGSLTDSTCRLEPGNERDDEAPALLRFAKELGTYGPYSIWSGEHGSYSHGAGFEMDSSNNLPMSTALSVFVDVMSPEMVVEVWFHFTEDSVVVDEVLAP